MDEVRHLGLSLGEIREALEHDGDLRSVVERQLEALDRRMEHDARLRALLVRVLAAYIARAQSGAGGR